MGRRITIVVEGSRGDWQPSVAGGAALSREGFEVQLLGPPDVKEQAERHGMTFVETWPMSSKEYATTPENVEAFTQNSFLKMITAATAVRKSVNEVVITRIYEALTAYKPELVLSAYLSLCESLAIGKVLGIPVLFFGLQPLVASRYVGAFGIFPVLPDVFRLNLRVWDYLNLDFAENVRKTSGPILEKLAGVPSEEFHLTLEEFYEHCSCSPKYPVLFGISKVLTGPLPPDFTDMCKVLGPVAMEPEKQEGPDFGAQDQSALGAFLAKGDAPVYIGFGSMICRNREYMTELSVRALKIANQRGVVLRGFAEMSEKDIQDPELLSYCKEQVLFVESAAHAKLFPKCKVMVHHGGSGTTSACAMSGVPAVVTPVFFDQFGNAELVNKQGNGVGMMKGLNSITAEELADALKTAQSPAIRQKAQEVAAEMAKENGAAQMVVEVKRFLQDVVDTGIYKSDKAAWEKRRLEAERKNWWPCCCS
ncbi:unnamed protein product [Effrenium voratum]|nr:unnamed protein product [Effrenium voratum]